MAVGGVVAAMATAVSAGPNCAAAGAASQPQQAPPQQAPPQQPPPPAGPGTLAPPQQYWPGPGQQDLGIGVQRPLHERLPPIAIPPVVNPVPPTCPPTCPPAYPPMYPPTCPPTNSPTCPPVGYWPVHRGPIIISGSGWTYATPWGVYPWPYYYGAAGYAVSGNGFDVFGSYTSRRWKVNVSVGTGGTLVLPVASTGPAAMVNYTAWTHPLWGAMDAYGTYYGWSRGTVVPQAGDARDNTPPAARATDPATMNDLERAAWCLRVGRADDAVAAARRYVKANDGDAKAWRVLAVALLEGKRPEDASAVLRRAYTIDAKLAQEPIGLAELGYGTQGARDLVSRAVVFAHRSGSASAWLTVAVLMQAQGRPEAAKPVLERARKAGLEVEIVAAMSAGLGG